MSPTTRSNGPDADGRSTDLQSDRMGSIPTVSTIWSYRLSVRSSGFHPGKRGSIPRRTTYRGVEQRKLVGLITQRSGVRIPLPQPKPTKLYYDTGSYLWVRGDDQERLINFGPLV